MLAALVSSGLPTDAFVFAGFPPPRAAARKTWLESIRAERRTTVIFEAPHRIRETLADMLEILGDRQVALGRELTKLHEEVLRGSVSAVLTRLGHPRGEYTIVLAGQADAAAHSGVEVEDGQLFAEFGRLTETAGRDGKRLAIWPAGTACVRETCSRRSIAPGVLDPFRGIC